MSGTRKKATGSISTDNSGRVPSSKDHNGNVISQVMAPFATTSFPESRRLRSKSGFIKWFASIKGIGATQGPEFVKFIDEQDTSTDFFAKFPGHYNSWLTELLQVSIDETLYESYLSVGPMLFGKYMLEKIRQEFNVFTPQERVEFALRSFERASTATLDHQVRINSLNDFWFVFSSEKDISVQQAIFYFGALRDQSFIDDYFKVHTRPFTAEGLQSYVRSNWEKLTRLPENVAFTAVAEKVAGSDARFRQMCKNCFGFGHESSSCSSPIRQGPIPNVKTVWPSTFDAQILSSSKRRSGFSGRKGANKKQHVHQVSIEDSTVATSNEDSDDFIFAVSQPDSLSVDDTFFFDTGATQHICQNPSLMFDFKTCPPGKFLTVANAQKVPILGYGTVKLRMPSTEIIELHNVQFAPGIKKNLINPRLMLQYAATADKFFTMNEFGIFHTTLGCLGRYDSTHSNMINCLGTPIHSPTPAVLAIDTDSLVNTLSHDAMGHPGHVATRHVLKSLNSRDRKEFIQHGALDPCNSCLLSNPVQNFPKRSTKTTTRSSTHPLNLLHMDVAGPHKSAGLFGENYFLVIVDDYTRFIKVFPIQHKHAVADVVMSFITQAEKFFSVKEKCKVITIRTDNGSEFVNHKLKSFCESKGIIHDTTTPHSSWQNGCAERCIGAVRRKASVLLQRSSLPISFWPYAVMCAEYLINRLPSTTIGNIAPYTKWYGSKPSFDNIHAFGCLAAAKIPLDLRTTKFDTANISTIFVGYRPRHAGYYVYDPKQNRVFVSAHVSFNDSFFPARDDDSVTIPASVTVSNPIGGVVPARFDDSRIPPAIHASTASVSFAPVFHQLTSTAVSVARPEGGKYIPLVASHVTHPTLQTDPAAIVNLVHGDSSISKAQGEQYIPNTYKQAMSCADKDEWYEAMLQEMNSHEINRTWQLVDLPAGREAIGNRWVYTKKSATKFKARLVAQGFKQVQGVDFTETFAPVIRSESIKLLISLAAKTGKVIHQMDVVTAFLNSNMDEVIYMKQPVGFQDHTKPNQVCKLVKSLYGLRQAPLIWNNTINQVLVSNGYKRIFGELGLYHNGKVVIGLYVDDLLLAGEDGPSIDKAKQLLHSHFKMKDLGIASKFLGMNIHQSPEEIHICLKDYIIKVVDTTDLQEDSNPVKGPYDPKVNLIDDDDDDTDLVDQTAYRSLVGQLLFAANTVRLDIAFITGVLSRYFHKAKSKHMKAAKRVVRYLLGTADLGLTYGRNGNLQVFADADWASSSLDRRSITGYLVKYAGSVISWKSKKQPSVALSTTEAGYMALAEAGKEILWITQLFKDFHVDVKLPIVIHEDNQSCLLLANHPVHHQRTKHIDIRYHFTRELIEKGIIKVKWISTSQMLADLLTKQLKLPQFLYLRSLCGLAPLGSRGNVRSEN